MSAAAAEERKERQAATPTRAAYGPCDFDPPSGATVSRVCVYALIAVLSVFVTCSLRLSVCCLVVWTRSRVASLMWCTIVSAVFPGLHVPPPFSPLLVPLRYRFPPPIRSSLAVHVMRYAALRYRTIVRPRS